MSRSLKKGPFVEERLLKRVEVMNEKGEKQVLKTFYLSDFFVFDHWLLHLDDRSEHKAPERSEAIVACALGCHVCKLQKSPRRCER